MPPQIPVAIGIWLRGYVGAYWKLEIIGNYWKLEITKFQCPPRFPLRLGFGSGGTSNTATQLSRLLMPVVARIETRGAVVVVLVAVGREGGGDWTLESIGNQEFPISNDFQ